MNLTLKKNGGLPSLLPDFFGTSLVDRDFFDLDSGLFPSRLGINIPTANVVETPREYTLELAAPGLERKDFTVEIDNQILKISADKKEEREEKNGGYSRREYSFSSFTRSFALPENIKEGDVDAKYDKGVLRVSIPKSKETPIKPLHKIAVQ